MRRLTRDDSGPTAVEYAVMAAFFAAAIVATVGVFSGAIEASFRHSATTLGAANGKSE